MQLLLDLYKIQSKSCQEKQMLEFLCSWITDNCPSAIIENDQKGNLYITKGTSDTYPVVVSHVDQVQMPKTIEAVRYKDLIFGYNPLNNELAGLGADDKNGVWICLQCLLKFEVIKLAFFVSEETGCVGSQNCDISFFKDARFVIQCDRKGNKDFIATACGVKLCSDEFIKDAGIADFKYEVCHTGGLTDVKTLRSRGLTVCSCNISCGYYEPHTDHETTCVSHLLNCQSLVERMITRMTKVYPAPKEPAHTVYPYSKSWGFFPDNRIDFDYSEEDVYAEPPKKVTTPPIKKVKEKDYKEQLELVKIGLKDFILCDPHPIPYNFFMENREVFPNISYATIVKIYNSMKRELS